MICAENGPEDRSIENISTSSGPCEISQGGAGDGRETQRVGGRELSEVGWRRRIDDGGGFTAGSWRIAQEIHPPAAIENPRQDVIRDESENIVKDPLDDPRRRPRLVDFFHYAPAEENQDDNTTPRDALGDDGTGNG